MPFNYDILIYVVNNYIKQILDNDPTNRFVSMFQRIINYFDVKASSKDYILKTYIGKMKKSEYDTTYLEDDELVCFAIKYGTDQTKKYAVKTYAQKHGHLSLLMLSVFDNIPIKTCFSYDDNNNHQHDIEYEEYSPLLKKHI